MRTSGNVYILAREDARQSLVFGLTWFALVGSHIAPMARARARQLKATHYVAGGVRAAAGGCARLGRQGRRGELYAAAQAYAQLYPDGAMACIVPLPDERYWLVAAQDGAVLSRGDRLFASAQAAELALGELREQRPELRVQDGATVLDRLRQVRDPAARLLAVDTRWGGLPWPVRAFAIGLLAAVVLPRLWHYVSTRAASRSDVVVVDADAAWKEAIDAWRASLRVHSQAELQRVVQSLYGMPLAVRGWRLQRAQCMPDAAVWRCVAHVERVLPRAAFDELAGALPPGWHAQFEAVGLSTLHWQVAGQGGSLASGWVMGRAPGVFASDLQRVAMAFAEVQLSPAVPMTAPAPRDAAGMPLAPPSEPGLMPRLRARQLSISGPLRSFGVLALGDTAASWSSLTLRLEPGRQGGLAASVLVAQLQGTVYEEH
ncbi:type 4b pilus protein PilO2 [Bordetella genomosp. 13]|uniref:Type 4b pilus protein PilO2 n=1 Tax=Bordetella genomosp. 13 TaxID=463040 RepID=A0A1W6ZBI9_9BORD|nr:type 4b pilus protein PilO2 [Bordetella genomosp. 13]ARP94743.1 hypothetical protein CAL15_10300 [Bordetella genomosp. 13]